MKGKESKDGKEKKKRSLNDLKEIKRVQEFCFGNFCSSEKSKVCKNPNTKNHVVNTHEGLWL